MASKKPEDWTYDDLDEIRRKLAIKYQDGMRSVMVTVNQLRKLSGVLANGVFSEDRERP